MKAIRVPSGDHTGADRKPFTPLASTTGSLGGTETAAVGVVCGISGVSFGEGNSPAVTGSGTNGLVIVKKANASPAIIASVPAVMAVCLNIKVLPVCFLIFSVENLASSWSQ